jgi:hypothetical protein
VFNLNVRWQWVRKNLVAAVNPAHLQWQPSQCLSQRPTHVPAAKQGDKWHGGSGLRKLRLQSRNVCRGDTLKAKHHFAPTTLTQRRPQGKTPRGRTGLTCQTGTRFAERLPL